MVAHRFRLTAVDPEEASARVWGKYPTALTIVIQYLYCGWYQCEVWI